MLVGVLFLVAEILIAVYPPLLSLIVAGVMIFIGISLVSISYYYKKLSKRFENPYVDFFVLF